MALSMTLSGRPLRMADNARFSQRLVSPLFSETPGGADYSLPFTLPPSPENQRAFGFAQMPESAQPVGRRYADAVLYDDGLVLAEGELELMEASPSGFKATLRMGMSILGERLRQIRLREIDWTVPLTVPEPRRFLRLTLSDPDVLLFPGLIVGLVIERDAMGRNQRYRVHYTVQVQEGMTAADLIDRMVFNINTPDPVPPYVLGTFYPAGSVVRFGQSLFEALIGTDSGPGNPSVWRQVETLIDYEQLSQEAEDPLDDYQLEAERDGNMLVLYPLNLDTHFVILDTWGTSLDNFYWNIESETLTSTPQLQPQTTDVLTFVAAQNAGTYPASQVAYPVVRNDRFEPEENENWFGYANYIAADGAYGRNPSVEQFHALTPMAYLRHVLDRIGELIGGWTFAGEWLTDAAVSRLIVFSTFSQDEFWAASTGRQNVYSRRIVLGHLLPDLSASELLVALCQFFFLEVDVEVGTRRLLLRRADYVLANSPTLDVSEAVENELSVELDARPSAIVCAQSFDGADERYADRVEPSDYEVLPDVETEADLPFLNHERAICRVRRLNAWFRPFFDLEPPTGFPRWRWEQLGPAYADVVVAGRTDVPMPQAGAPYVTLRTEAVTRQTAICPVSIYLGEDANAPGRTWLVPDVSQPQRSLAAFRRGYAQDFALRLLNYYGLQPDSQGNEYPMASPDVLTWDGTVLPGLRLSFEETIVEGGAELLDLQMHAKRVELRLRLKSVQTQALTRARLLRADRVTYVVEDLKINYPATGLTTVTGYVQ